MEQKNAIIRQGNMVIHIRLLDAPGALVWEVWTNPAHLKEWWGPDGFSLTTQSMSVVPGQCWDFIMHGMGQDWDNRIEYVEVSKPSRLRYKHSGAEEDAYNFTVSVSFEELEGKTLMTMASVFKSEAIIEELDQKVNAIEAGKQTLRRLGDYLEIVGKL